MPTGQSPGQPSFGAAFDGAPKHRLFFAIWPNADATDRLTKLTARLTQNKIMPGRPVDADRLHVTLYHLGDFADQIPKDLVPTACLAAARVTAEPFQVAFDRIGGTRGQFLLRPSERIVGLMEFQKTLGAALLTAGVRPKLNAAFNPHMTLSYDFSDAPEQQIDPISWTASQFVLIESLLGKHKHIIRGSWKIQR